MERAVIVFNPAARNAPSRQRVISAARALAADGWEVELRATEQEGHGIELAREAAREGASVVVSCGGDGTINEVVNGLAGTGTALAVMRGGMGDVFGKEARIPRNPESALRVLVDGVRHRVDLGRANQRYFLLMAGVGLDAEVVRAVPSWLKRRLGSTSYAIWGMKQLAAYRSRGVVLRVDGEERDVRLYWLLLGNTRSYGGIKDITAGALMDDGLLDAYVFEGRSPGWLASMALRLALGRQDGGKGVTFQRVRDLEVVSLGLPVQLDGEYVGESPVRFTVAPGALELVLHPDSPAPLSRLAIKLPAGETGTSDGALG